MSEPMRKKRKNQRAAHVERLLGRQSPSARAAPWLKGRLDPLNIGGQVRELVEYLVYEHFIGRALAEALLPQGLREEVDAIVERFERSKMLRDVLQASTKLGSLGELLDMFIQIAVVDLVRKLRTRFDQLDWPPQAARNPQYAEALERVKLLQQPRSPAGRPRADPTVTELAKAVAYMAGDQMLPQHVDQLVAGLANELLGLHLEPSDVKRMLWRHRRDERRDRRAREQERQGDGARLADTAKIRRASDGTLSIRATRVGGSTFTKPLGTRDIDEAQAQLDSQRASWNLG